MENNREVPGQTKDDFIGASVQKLLHESKLVCQGCGMLGPDASSCDSTVPFRSSRCGRRLRRRLPRTGRITSREGQRNQTGPDDRRGSCSDFRLACNKKGLPRGRDLRGRKCFPPAVPYRGDVPSVIVKVESASTPEMRSMTPLGQITSTVASVAALIPKCNGSLPCEAYSPPPPPLFCRKLCPLVDMTATRAPIPAMFDFVPTKLTLMK